MSMETRTVREAIWRDIEAIRSSAPLVHNITNYVVMNTTANALLCIGASPVMAHAEEEVVEMCSIASSLVINIGTLSRRWIDAMVMAGRTAVKRGIPIVLDPVGAGATALRTTTARRLLDDAPPAIIRGNASEIRALAYAESGTKGVDATHGADAALDAAIALSKERHCVVSVSGEVDVIVRGDRVSRVHNGHPMMPRVTGLGCTASALTGAFAAVRDDPFEAAVHAMSVMGVTGEIAASRAEGPGTLQLHFLDALYRLNRQDLERLRGEWA